jgi:hypothetical protein
MDRSAGERVMKIVVGHRSFIIDHDLLVLGLAPGSGETLAINL